MSSSDLRRLWTLGAGCFRRWTSRGKCPASIRPALRGAVCIEPLESRMLLSALPTVTAVYVLGTPWNAAFLNDLAANATGSAAYGYRIPTGSDAQLAGLPWGNINEVSIAFSADVAVAQASLAKIGRAHV